MRVHYLDASAWVKRYFKESGTRLVRELFEHREPLIVSSLGHLEVRAAIARQAASRRFDPVYREYIESVIDYECRQSLFVDILRQHFSRAVGLTRESDLRGADALHLAIAAALKEEFERRGDELIFWTADKELIRAATQISLLAINPADYE